MSLSLVLNKKHSGYFTNYYFNVNALKSRYRKTIPTPGLPSPFELQVSVIIEKFCALKRWVLVLGFLGGFLSEWRGEKALWKRAI